MVKKSNLKAALKADEEEFVLMGNTRALISDVWNHWRQNLGHTPEVAKKMMDAAIKEMHSAEVGKPKRKLSRKISKAKKAVKSEVKSVKRKAKTLKRKVKAATK